MVEALVARARYRAGDEWLPNVQHPSGQPTHISLVSACNDGRNVRVLYSMSKA